MKKFNNFFQISYLLYRENNFQVFWSYFSVFAMNRQLYEHIMLNFYAHIS